MLDAQNCQPSVFCFTDQGKLLYSIENPAPTVTDETSVLCLDTDLELCSVVSVLPAPLLVPLHLCSLQGEQLQECSRPHLHRHLHALIFWRAPGLSLASRLTEQWPPHPSRERQCCQAEVSRCSASRPEGLCSARSKLPEVQSVAAARDP